jgi:hypothetical protein
MKHSQGMCVKPQTWIQVDEGIQTGSMASIPMDSCTQMTPTCTIDAVMQTELQDKPLHPLRDVGTSTGTPIMSTEPPSPTVPSPQPAPLPPTSQPMTYASHHTATSWLPTPSTTATTVTPPPSKWPTTPQKRRHSLPGEPTALQQAPQPFILHLEQPTAVAMSQPPTPMSPTETTSKMASRAAATTQTVATTSETANQAIRHLPWQPVAQQTELHDNEQTCLLSSVIYLTDEPHRPHHPQQ